jgi:CBS domain-containing protein
MSQLSPVDNVAPRRPSDASDAAKNLELLQDLIDTLTARQKNLVIDLGRGAPPTTASLHARIPKGTRELLESHNVIDTSGSMTPLGKLLADQLAFEAGEGPDPRLAVRGDEGVAIHRRLAGGMEIRDLVCREVITVAPAHTLAQAAGLMSAHRVGSAIVCTEEGPGILSERDILRAVADGADLNAATVADYMTWNAIIADSSWDTMTAARTMLEYGFRHLIVIDNASEIGILSIRDLMAAHLGITRPPRVDASVVREAETSDPGPAGCRL